MPAMATQTPLGRRVRDARERAGLSLADLAQQAGVNESTLWRIEEGRSRSPHADVVTRLAAALRTTPNALLLGSP